MAANASALFESAVTTQALAVGADGTLTIGGHLLIASNVVDSFATIDTGGELIVNGPATQGTAAISAVAGAGASLTVTVDGGLLEAMNGALVVGVSGNATLTVINGGSVSSTTEFPSDSALVVGGTVQVNGVGSALTAVGQIVVGYNGAGKLSVQSGGTVFSGNSTVSPNQGTRDRAELRLGRRGHGPGDRLGTVERWAVPRRRQHQPGRRRPAVRQWRRSRADEPGQRDARGTGRGDCLLRR